MRFSVASLVLVLGNFLTIIIEGFQVTSRININRNQHDRISFDVLFRKATSPTSSTTTWLKMVDENTKDPDALLKMVEELTMDDDEITPEIMAKMEKVEIALANFLDENGAVLLERQQQEQEQQESSKPHPPSIPPPGTLFEEEDATADNDDDGTLQIQQQQQQQQQNQEDAIEELSVDYLKQAGNALEKLRYRLRQEEEVLFNTEQSLQRSLEEQDILREAEEALQKSRMAAAERRSNKVEATEKQQEQQKEIQQNSSVNNNEISNQNQTILPANIIGTRQRSTIELGSIFKKQNTKRRREIDDNGNNDNDDVSRKATSEQQQGNNNKMSEGIPGIPILYNWKQCDDGSITGNIRGSPNFRNGATISTSAITQGAHGGTIVTTLSGSRYFLEELTTIKESDEVYSEQWWQQEQQKRRILKTEDASNDAMSILNAFKKFKDVATSTVRRSKDAITITKDRDDVNTTKSKKDNTRSAMEILEKSPPRSTFSLFDLFDGEKSDNKSKTTMGSSPLPPTPTPAKKRPPAGTPTLTEWNMNDDGTITGFIFGSRNIGDGYLITTSPIVNGRRKQFEMVKTATGSLYFLG
jgi:hypothetical protein